MLANVPIKRLLSASP